MRTVEERVTNLEEVLAEFISQTNERIVATNTATNTALNRLALSMSETDERIRATNATVDKLALEMKDFKDEMNKFKDEMKEFKDEMKEFKDEMKEFKDEMREFKDEMREFKDEMKDFKDEMKDFKDEMKDFKNGVEKFKEEAEKDRKQMNKQWGELANKMGTIAEDLVYPAVRPVLEKYFDCMILDKGLRIERKTKDGSRGIEVDVIAVSVDKVFMIEVRSKPTNDYVNEVLGKTKKFREFFPEYNDKELIPILASLVFQDDVINYANKKRLYLMAYREWEYMDIINFDKVKRRGSAK